MSDSRPRSVLHSCAWSSLRR